MVVISRVGRKRPAIPTPLVAVQAAFAVGQAPAATVKTGLAQAAVLIKVNVEHVAKVAISGSGNRMFFLLQPHTRGIEEIGIKKIFAEKTILRNLGEWGTPRAFTDSGSLAGEDAQAAHARADQEH